MKIQSGFVLRHVAKNKVVLPTGRARSDFNGMISLNDVGAFLWEQLQTEQTLQTLAEAVTTTYDVSGEQAAADIEKFLSALRENGLLDESNEQEITEP